MSKYDECLDLIVDYFNEYYEESYYNNTNTSKIIKKINNLPEDKILPVLLYSSLNDYNTILKYAAKVVKSTVYEYAYKDYSRKGPKINFYKDKGRLFFSVVSDDLVGEVRFKKLDQDREKFEENYMLYFNDGNGIIISPETVTNILGTPAFDMNDSIIKKCFDDILVYAKECLTQDDAPAGLQSFVNQRMDYYMTENVYNNFYKVNTEAIKNTIQNNYAPTEVVNTRGESVTICIYIDEDDFLTHSSLYYSLKDDVDWFVLPEIMGNHFNYLLQSTDDKNVLKLDLRAKTKTYYLYKDANNDYAITDKKVNNGIYFGLMDDVVYLFNYSKNY